MPKTKSEEAKIDFSGNPFFSGKFPSLGTSNVRTTPPQTLQKTKVTTTKVQGR